MARYPPTMRRPFRSIGQALYGAFAVTGLVFLVCILLFYASFTRILRGEALSRESTTVILETGRLRQGLLGMESGQRGFLITMDESYLDQYTEALEEASASLEALRASIDSDPEGSSLFKRLEDQIGRWRTSYLDFSLELAKTGTVVSSSYLSRGAGYTGAMWNLLGELQEREEARMRLRAAELSRVLFLSRLILLLGGFLGTATALLAALLLGRFVRPPLKAVAASLDRIARGRLGGSSLPLEGRDEIAALSRSEALMHESLNSVVGSLSSAVEGGSSLGRSLSSKVTSMESSLQGSALAIDQAASLLEETSSHIEIAHRNGVELDAFIEKTLEQIQAEGAAVNESAAAVVQMTGGIDALAEDSRLRQVKALELSASARDGEAEVHALLEGISSVHQAVATVASLAGLISEVAERTNLLSMNAAIEAAHAGESGKGFAVVAEEIRRLSEESTEGAQEIFETIDRAQDLIELASEAGERAGFALTKLLEGVDASARSGAASEARLSEMSSGTAEMREALSSLSRRAVELSEAGHTAVERSENLRTMLNQVAQGSSAGRAALEGGRAALLELVEDAAALDDLGKRNRETLEKLEAELSRFS